VEEYFNLTELSLLTKYSPAVTILTEGSVADLPAAIEVNPPADAALSKTYLETLEGMRVTITGAATVTGPTSEFWEYFVVNPASGVTRPFQRDNQSGLPVGVSADSGTTARLLVTSGDIVSGLVGPLDYTFSAFRIQPQSNALPTITTVGPTIPNQVVGAGVTGNQFSVASFNTENFFDDVDDPTISDTVYTTTNYNNKSAKVARAINDNLSRPTIIGLQEIENTAVLSKTFSQPIFAGINYGYILGAATDGRGIKVAFAYRTDKVRINNSYSYQCYTPGSTTDALSNDNATFNCTIFPTASSPATPNGQVALFARAPLAVVATVQPGGTAGPFLQAVFIVNHLKSKTSGPASDPDSTIRRKNEGEELAKLVTRIVTDGQPNVLVMGDLNDYENSPMATGISSGTGSSQLQNLTSLVAAPDRYSYVFSGTSQVLDHILVTPGFFNLYKTNSAVFAKFDADFPYYRNTTGSTTSLSVTSDANGVSDHNPPLAVFDITTTTGCSTTKVVSSSDDGTGTSCGSLSYALKNAAPNQTIGFQLGLTEIKPSAALPAFSSGVKLDGGCIVDTTTGRGRPGVRLDGAGIIGTPTVGLTLVGDNTINGLSIVGYSDYAIDISGNNNTLSCSWLGTADGITKQANAGGIRFKNTAGSNNIGLVGDKKSGNLISGNTGYGVLDSAIGGSANRFYYNLIGYDKAGALSLRNGKGLKDSGGSRFSFGPGNRISN